MQIFISELENELGEDRERILGGIGNILRDEVLPGFEKVANGGPWVYLANHPSGRKADTQYFELKFTTRKGAMILEGEDGKLYRATELELDE